MKVHLQLFDHLGASALFSRFKDRFPNENCGLWEKMGVHMQNYDFENLVKNIEDTEI